MRAKLFTLLISVTCVLTIAACSGNIQNTMKAAENRETVLRNDNTNEERNQLLTEDIQYFKTELPKRHKNLFHTISEDEFNDRTDQLMDQIDQLNNGQVFIELNKIVASVGDAHTTINYWDGYSYPLQFIVLDGKVYIINADTKLEGMMYAQLVKIDGVDINQVIKQLTELISQENESWVLARLPEYLQSPVYMAGLGIVKNEKKAVFTVQKEGTEQEFTVTALEFGESPDYVNKSEDVLAGIYETNYNYEYLAEDKALYFQYNVCEDMKSQSFEAFNQDMYDAIEKNELDKIIVDLRNNSGGNSEVLNPFTEQLKSYLTKHAEVRVYILVGRNTFSSGMFAIYRVKEAAPEAISLGEPTGGALDCYGEVKSMNLPNSQIPVSYSTKYFEFSKSFRYKNDGVDTFLPDIELQPNIEDYMSGNDVVLEYALADE